MTKAVKLSTEQRLFGALKRIASYEAPAKLHKNAERNYGLGASEAIEMAYENVLAEAKDALKGVRVKMPALPAPQGTPDA